MVAGTEETRAESAWPSRAQVERLKRDGPGWLTSLLLHGLALALILMLLKQQQPEPGQTAIPFIPVTLVPFGGSSNAPREGENAAPLTSNLPMVSPRQAPAHAPSRVGISSKVAPKDELDAKLENLSRLTQRQSGSLPSARDFAVTEPGEGGEGEGQGGPYGVRDLVRAQVLRRWSLNFQTLGMRNFTIPVRVELTRTGRVLKAEIVDQQRFRTDKIYRDIALSARNAVILSSPLTLPAGQYGDVFDMIVLLNPRDTQK